MHFHEKCFFNLVRALWNRRRARVGVYATPYILKQNIFLSGLSTKKVLISLWNFALIKVLECSFTKSVFQSSQELVQKEWELERVCMNPSKFSNRKNFDPCALRKSTHVVVKFCAHKNLCIKKNLDMQFHKKCFSIYWRTCSKEVRSGVEVYSSR